MPGKAHYFTESVANAHERLWECLGLAAALRSSELDRLLFEGWEFIGVRKMGDDAAPDLAYRYRTAAVPDNRKGDVILLRMARDEGK